MNLSKHGHHHEGTQERLDAIASYAAFLGCPHLDAGFHHCLRDVIIR
jgi:hypothetical protein